MDEGSASRTIEVQVDKNAALYYYPQPVIPFAQSAFDSKMTIHLEDETSKLFCWRSFPVVEMHMRNDFSIADFPSKGIAVPGRKTDLQRQHQI